MRGALGCYRRRTSVFVRKGAVHVWVYVPSVNEREERPYRLMMTSSER